MQQITRSPSYLIRNPHSYCFRIIVPQDLQPIIRRKELRRSLKTGYLRTAKSKSRLMAGHVQLLFRELRRNKQVFMKLTDQQIQRMVTTYREVDIDRYGRTVATVYLEDGRELNLEILKAGFAWHYKRCSDRQDYANAEETARRDGIGLWADPNALPPWDWRREQRGKG